MPENMVTHAEWHGKVIAQLRGLEDQVRVLRQQEDLLNRHLANVTDRVIELWQGREADLEAQRETMERD